MSIYDQQIAALRRDINLMKGTQVTIYSTQPRSPNTQAIWRDGGVIKVWDGSNWNVMGGGISDFSVDVVFTPVDYNTVSWGSGVINIASSGGTASFAISSGSFDLTTTTYFYWQEDIPTAIQTTTDAAIAVQNGGLLVATGFPNADTAGKVTLNVFGGKGPSPFIVNADIANGAVNAIKTDLAAISSLTGYLNPNTVDTTQIVDNAITSLKVLNGAISTAKIALLAIDSSLIAANAVTETKILNDSITSPKILAGAVVAGKIAANAVTANEIASGSITTSKIFAGAVTANELAANSVVAGKIAAGTIVAGDIAAGAITAAKILAGTITAAQIAAGTITAAEIATGTITAAKLVANTITANELSTALIYAGSITLSSGGVVRSGKSTYADTLTGFWLGSDSGTPKFKIGTSTQYMDWNGTAFSIVGGTITGSTIQTSTSGERIVLESNKYKAYDSSGVLRIQSNGSGFRFTDYSSTYNCDIEGKNYGSLSSIDVGGAGTGAIQSNVFGNRIGSAMDTYHRGGIVSFDDINSALGFPYIAASTDTISLVNCTTLNIGGIPLTKSGTDLYWNGVKIN